MLTAESFLRDSPFVMYLGDNLLQHGITPLVEEYRSLNCNSEILLTRVPNPSQFGVAELSSDGKVVKLTEKPQQPKSDLALVGVYMFDENIFDAAKAIRITRRTVAIIDILVSGIACQTRPISRWFLRTQPATGEPGAGSRQPGTQMAWSQPGAGRVGDSVSRCR